MTGILGEDLGAFPLFQNLSKVEMAKVFPFLRKKHYSGGEFLCRQHDEAKTLFYITEGSVQLNHMNASEDTVSLGQLCHMTFYGATELIDEMPYEYSLVALRDTKVIEISKSGLMKILHYDPSFLPFLLTEQEKIFRRTCASLVETLYQDYYILTQIWKRFSRSEQDFICSTFLMDRISPDRCTELLGDINCVQVFEKLRTYPLILNKIDSDNDWEYTEILKTFLTQNQYVSEDQIQGMHRNLAEFAKERQNLESAVHHYLEIEDFDEAFGNLDRLVKSGWDNLKRFDDFRGRFPRNYPDMGVRLAGAKKEIVDASSSQKRTAEVSTSDLRTTIEWILCLASPFFVYWICVSLGFSSDQRIFLSALASAVIMWMFKLVSEYIVSIFIVIVCLTTKCVPSQVILSGFVSGAFFLAMSVFGLGAVLVSSGIVYRLSLMILYYFPPTLFWQNLALTVMGTLTTPMVPSANGRMVLVSPIIMDMVESMGYQHRSKPAVRLSMSALSGFGLMSAFFLTGKSTNFVLLGLLAIDLQARFTFTYWMMAAAVAATCCFIGRFLLAAILYKAENAPLISKDDIKNQLAILGRLNSSEWTAIAASLVFFFGVITSKIMTPWLAVMILFAVLFVGELSEEDFKREIDWPFLLFLGGLIGFVKAFSHLGFDKMVGTHLFFLSGFMTSNFYIFIVFLTLITLGMRFILPANAAFALLCVTLLPLAQAKGVNPWVVGFCILISSSGWVLPYQSTFYITLYNRTKGKMFSDQQAAPYNILGNLITIIALLLSVPYWKMLGLLK